VKVYFERRKIANVFMTHGQVFFRKSLSKATFERKLSSVLVPLHFCTSYWIVGPARSEVTCVVLHCVAAPDSLWRQLCVCAISRPTVARVTCQLIMNEEDDNDYLWKSRDFKPAVIRHKTSVWPTKRKRKPIAVGLSPLCRARYCHRLSVCMVGDAMFATWTVIYEQQLR